MKNIKRKLLILPAVLLGFSLAACGEGGGAVAATSPPITPPPPAQTTPQITPAPVVPNIEEETEMNYLERQIAMPAEGEEIAIITTNFGVIRLRLFPEHAPLAVENFVTHANDGFYDGVIFHRIIPNFMIQGGDPTGTGRGGGSIWGHPFECQTTPNLAHIRGALSMANAGANTNGSQFFIVDNTRLAQQNRALVEANPGERFLPEFVAHYLEHGGTPHLDGGHTVFGQVFDGMDVVDEIARVRTGDGNRPVNDVVIESIRIENFQP